jgi:hypothetical protein
MLHHLTQNVGKREIGMLGPQQIINSAVYPHKVPSLFGPNLVPQDPLRFPSVLPTLQIPSGFPSVGLALLPLEEQFDDSHSLCEDLIKFQAD